MPICPGDCFEAASCRFAGLDFDKATVGVLCELFGCGFSCGEDAAKLPYGDHVLMVGFDESGEFGVEDRMVDVLGDCGEVLGEGEAVLDEAAHCDELITVLCVDVKDLCVKECDVVPDRSGELCVGSL